MAQGTASTERKQQHEEAQPHAAALHAAALTRFAFLAGGLRFSAAALLPLADGLAALAGDLHTQRHEQQVLSDACWPAAT